jgi:hypothetical protein
MKPSKKMDWTWLKSGKDEKLDPKIIKRPPISARQRAIERESIIFINERNKREQGKFVQLAVIDRTLKDTISLMEKNVGTLMERGDNVDVLIQKTEDLTESSKLFLFEVLPWYKRLWFFLWGYFNCSCCQESRSKRTRDHII